MVSELEIQCPHCHSTKSTILFAQLKPIPVFCIACMNCNKQTSYFVSYKAAKRAWQSGVIFDADEIS